MKFYHLALVFFVMLVAAGQQEEYNNADWMLLQENGAIDSSAATITSGQSIGSIDVTLEMAILDGNTTARFKRGNRTEGPLSPAKLVLYRIWVYNSGIEPLSDVTLSAELDKGIQYETSKYYEERRGDLEAIKDPDPPNENLKTDVTWNLNFLNPSEIKSILLETYVKKNVDEKGVSVNVKGKASDGEEVVDSDSAPSEQCGYKYTSGESKGTKCMPWSEDDEDCKYQCPDWAKAM